MRKFGLFVSCFMVTFILVPKNVGADEPGTSATDKPSGGAPIEAPPEPSPSATNPFGGSQAAQREVDRQILQRMDSAISKIDNLQTGIDEIKVGQRTTNDLLRGLVSDAAEGKGSLLTAKEEIRAEGARVKQEIGNHTDKVVADSVGKTLSDRGYTKPIPPASAPAPAVATNTAVATPAVNNTYDGTGTYQRHDVKGNLVQLRRPVSGFEKCPHCGATDMHLCSSNGPVPLATMGKKVAGNAAPIPAPATCASGSSCNHAHATQGAVAFWSN